MMEWHTISEKPTNEKAQYLLIVSAGKNHKLYQLARYTNNYCKLSKYDFDESDGGGFYKSDPEWGFVKVSNVLVWSELTEIPPCFEPKD